MIDWSKNIIFIHIPRTAGTSVETLLNIPFTINNLYGINNNNKAMQHLTAKQIKNTIPIHIFNKSWIFSIIRHPYSRMVSEFYWRPNLQSSLSPLLKNNTNFILFLRKVLKIVENKQYHHTLFHDHFIPIYDFLTIDNKLIPNYILRFEHIHHDISIIKKKLNIDIDLPKLETTIYSKKYTKSILTPKAKLIIQQIYQKDFQYFQFKP